MFYSKDKGFTEEIRYMNPNYLTYHGAIRVFQPGVNEAFRHRYLTALDIETYGEEQITHFLCRAFDQNINFYDSFFWIDTCRKKKAEYIRKQRLEEIHSQYQDRLDQQALELIEEGAIAIEAAENEAKNLRKENGDLKQKNHNLVAQLDQMKLSADENIALRRSVSAREGFKQLPETPMQVIEYFAEVFGDRIEFSEEAISSSKQCTLQGSVVWEVMFALSTVMWELYKNGTGDIYKQFYKLTSIV